MSEDKKRKVGFVPEYLHPAVLKEKTADAIARIEMEKHNVHLVVAVNDDNWDYEFPNGETAIESLERLDKAIEDIKVKFEDVLAWAPPEDSQ